MISRIRSLIETLRTVIDLGLFLLPKHIELQALGCDKDSARRILLALVDTSASSSIDAMKEGEQ